MEKVLISVIGKNTYPETEYIFKGKSIRSNLVMDVLYNEIKLDQIYVLGTETSLWENIDKTNIPYKKIIIPYGEQNEDYIKIFKTISTIEVKDKEIYIDVTHGFRSIPFYLFSALNYFSIIQNAKIKGCYYGMYRGEGEQAPIVDMQSLMELQKWIGAYHVFNSSGISTEIADLLDEKQNDFYLNKEVDKSKGPKNLKKVSKALKDLSYAIGLNYTKEVKDTAHILLDLLQDKSVEEEIEYFVKQFSIIVPMLKEDLKNIVEHEYHWQIQLFLAELYYRYNRYTNCLTTLRELIITYLIEMVENKPEYIYNRKYRESISNKLHEKDHKNEDIKKIKQLYKDISDMRNVSGHGGMREEGRMRLGAAKEKIKDKIDLLKSILLKISR
ncbi:TIGR02221 family CRISPR-associated protein [Defluviitalea phaphyphila]|uniref:TIGR02221 family CRISPR-associated protein n=1 Tax=Defluviitalea phaphyphila TaxID=1473580 RepID=UPI00073124E7|nr:TIGR02221 family CRISPR-associated protein [Defluviitalea phaphyphila]